MAVAVGASLPLYGQVDTNYIEVFPPYLSISPYLSSSVANYRITSRMGAGDTSSAGVLDYQPNLRAGYGFDVSYRNIDFSISFRQRIDPVTEKLYGSSKYTGLGFRLSASRHLALEFSYKNIKGFSDINSPVYDSTLKPEAPFINRTDLSMQYAKVRAIYQFNPHKYSYRASFSFSERQKRRKMGYFLHSHLYALRIHGDSSLFYPAIAEKFREFSSINEVNVYSLGISPGVGGTLTKGKWFATAVLFLGVDAQYFNYTAQAYNRNYREFKIAPMVDFRLALGYNWKRFFCGFSTLADYNILNPSAFKISSTFSRTYLNLGYRFNAPKIVAKAYERFMPSYLQ